MTGFDDFLNGAIPIFIAIFFVFILGRAVRKPLGEFYDWIKSLFQRGGERIGESTSAITYE